MEKVLYCSEFFIYLNIYKKKKTLPTELFEALHRRERERIKKRKRKKKGWDLVRTFQQVTRTRWCPLLSY